MNVKHYLYMQTLLVYAIRNIQYILVYVWNTQNILWNIYMETSWVDLIGHY